MRPEDVQAMLKAEPFVPLLVRTTDGRSYRITHPKLSMVTRQRLVLGSPDPEDEDLAGDMVYLAWSVIDSVAPLVAEGAAA